MVRYYADRYRTGGDYWWDFHDDQFVFSHKDKETKDQIYLVDVEPYMREANPRNKGSEDVLRRISDVFELSKESEKKFSKPARFAHTRDVLKRALKGIREEDQHSFSAERLRLAFEKDAHD